MASNFAFLHDKFPEFEKLAELAESYCRSDSHSCLLKIGLLCEGMVKVMFATDRISLPERTDAAERIDILSRRGLLPQNVSAAFHLVRKVRNKAAHEGLSLPENQTLYYLQIVHSLCGWFYQTYGDERYQHAAFVAPAEPSAATPAPTTEAADEKLMARAESRAAEAPAAPEAQRRERAERASSRRYISEAETRLLIDEQLRKVGWEADTETLRYSKGTRPAPGRNIAIAEWPTDSPTGTHGFADYALFIGMKLVAVIEAKAAHKAIPSVLDQQCKEYAAHIRAEDQPHVIGEWRGYRVPFIFAANGRPYIKQWEEQSGIWFQDLREASNAPQALHGWMSPTGMEELLARDIADGNRRLSELPRDFLTDKDGLNLREYQLRAIQAAEEAIVAGRNCVLLAMATGTGKTRTVLGMMYRFLKSGRFRRILFLVDRTALGNQALDAFSDVKLEELMPLTDIYSVKSLEEKGIDKETRVHVATVQGMVKRILYSEDGEPRPAVSDYDLIIVDEAHRGYILDKEMTDEEQLYRDQRDYQSKYREVIEYFSAVKIALTATPALQTTEIFGPPVFTYMYREAVIDGYLVDHDAPHQLRTQLSDSGIHYKSGDKVITFDPITGEINNAELLDDELDFEVEHFNRAVINENFNRAILEEIARDIDPEDASSGKTLIYAVDDKHADMIVQILKEIYSRYCVDENAIMKITGSIGDRKRIDQAIRRFKNEAFPSIAVTVDLLTTGIDVPEITRLVFMRRVKSRILFEQMLGRATRLCPDIRKTHFEVYDAVGIYATLSRVSTMKPVAANPSTTFEQLLDGLDVLEKPAQILSQINQIIAKLHRRKRTMNDEQMAHFVDMAGGTPEAFIEELEGMKRNTAKEVLLSKRNLFRLMDAPSGTGRPVVIDTKPDALTGHTRGFGKDNLRPEDYLESFARFVKENRNAVAALNIVCTKPGDLTRESLKSLRLALDREGFTVEQLNSAVSHMSNSKIVADIISLIRRYAINAELLGHEERIRRAVNRLKDARRFSKIESNWIDQIEKYLLNESVLSVQTFDEVRQFRAKGGFDRLNKIFQNQLASIIAELNGYLYDDGGRAA